MEPLLIDSWDQMATVPIAVAVALLFVEFCKHGLRLSLGGVWWQRIAALIAVTVMVTATLLGGVEGHTILAVFVAVINGLIAGLAASRTYETGKTAVEWMARGDDR